MKKIILLTTLFFGLTGCEAVNTTLSSANSVLGGINNVLGGINSGLSEGTTTSSVIPIDVATRASIDNSLSKAVAPSEAKILFESVKPTINKMLQRAACGGDGNTMQIFAVPNTFGYSNVRWSMSHHTSGCVHVLRVNNIQKQAANAVSFTTLYMSPHSEETGVRNYTAIKQIDGEWLFQWY